MKKNSILLAMAAMAAVAATHGETIVAFPKEKNSGITIDGVKVGDEKYGNGWFFSNGVLQLNSSGSYTIAGTNTKGVVRIDVNADSTVTIKNLHIKTAKGKKHGAFVLKDGVTCNLYLKGQNELESGETYAGISVPENATLNVYGGTDDTLTAIGGKYGAGIGGHNVEGGLSPAKLECGTINIYGGRIGAAGGDYAAGIGGGSGARMATDGLLPGGDCGRVTINGGVVYAYGGAMGAGIGGGWKGSASQYTYNNFTRGIYINGGEVYARGGAYGAGIGAGSSMGRAGWVSGSCTITGGKVDAKGGVGAAGIGGGYFGIGGAQISGGKVTAKGGTFEEWVNGQDVGGAAIGGGFKGTGQSVRIEGGTVLTTPGAGAAHIGCGMTAVAGEYNKLYITGGSVAAIPNIGTSATPTDNNNVNLVQVTVGGLKAFQPVTLTGIDGYGGNDLYPDESGSVYLWLKPNAAYAFTCGGHDYEADVGYSSTVAHFTAQEARREYVRAHGTTFDVNGGDDSAGELLMLYEDASMYGNFPYKPSRTACWFTGWYTAAGGGTRKFENSAPVQGETLYAHWQMSVGSSRTAFYGPKACSYSHSGVERWFAQTNIVHETAQAMRSNVIGPNESTEMYLQDFEGPGNLSFYWNDRSSVNDHLEFRIDGECVARVGVKNVWKGFQTSIPAGKHKLSWVFTRGDVKSGAQDYDSAAYLAEMAFTPVPPANDDFADAVDLAHGESVYVDGDSVHATLESGESKGWNQATNTVWYKWTPTSAAPSAWIHVDAEDFTPSVEVFTGSAVDSLVEVGKSSGYQSSKSAEVEFVPSSGTTYYFRIASAQALPSYGHFTLKAWLSNNTPSWVPANDNFVNADAWSGESAKIKFTTTGSSYEENEPLARFYPSATNSVWIKWTAPFTGNVGFDTIGSDFMTVMGAYRISPDDTAFENVTAMAENACATGVQGWYSYCYFPCVKDEPYYICVAGVNGATGSLKLNWHATEAAEIEVQYDSGSGGMAKKMLLPTGTSLAAAAETTPDAEDTPEGYEFQGWSADENSEQQVSGSEVVDAPKVLYALWTPNQYAVRYNGNGATAGTMADMVVEYDAYCQLSPNAFARTGYTFNGWNTQANGSGDGYADQEEIHNLTDVKNGVVIFYAQWKANAYAVKFDANGGTGKMANLAMAYGATKALTANAFKRTGYTFLGWAKSKSAAKADYADKASVKNLATSGTVTLYAVWKQDATYTVKFFVNDGTKTAKTQTVKVGASAALTKAAKLGVTRAGWEFRGWAVSASAAAAGTVKYKDGASVKDLAKQGKTVDLYAVWALPAWATGTFYGDCECAAAEGVMTVKITAAGKLTGTMTWANGKKKSIVKTFTASAPAYTASYKKKSFAKAFDCAADGDLKLADGSCWTYKKVKVPLPKGGSVTGSILVANCKVVDGNVRAGDIVFVGNGKLEFDLAQDLWTNAEVKNLPNLKKKPVKTLKVKNSGHDQKALYQAGVRKLSFKFADKGAVTATALDAKGKKLNDYTTHLLVDGVKGGKYFGWTPVYFKKLGRLAWFGVDVKKKSGAAQAADVTLGFDD